MPTGLACVPNPSIMHCVALTCVRLKIISSVASACRPSAFFFAYDRQAGVPSLPRAPPAAPCLAPRGAAPPLLLPAPPCSLPACRMAARSRAAASAAARASCKLFSALQVGRQGCGAVSAFSLLEQHSACKSVQEEITMAG